MTISQAFGQILKVLDQLHRRLAFLPLVSNHTPSTARVARATFSGALGLQQDTG